MAAHAEVSGERFGQPFIRTGSVPIYRCKRIQFGAAVQLRCRPHSTACEPLFASFMNWLSMASYRVGVSGPVGRWECPRPFELEHSRSVVASSLEHLCRMTPGREGTDGAWSPPPPPPPPPRRPSPCRLRYLLFRLSFGGASWGGSFPARCRKPNGFAPGGGMLAGKQRVARLF